MKPYKELKYDILKYVNEHIKSKKTMTLSTVLKEIGEEELVGKNRDLGKKLNEEGALDIIWVSGGRVGIRGITFDGKQYLLNYTETKINSTDGSTKTATKQILDDIFIDKSRITELRTISNAQFDLKRLIKLCEEINQNFSQSNYLSVAMLGRTILNHVPPIFSHKSFKEVANNYGGAGNKRSFKKSMQHLSNSLKNIGDNHLHKPIESNESLPTRTQVNFSQDMDVLLGEIIVKLKGVSK